MIYIYHLVKKDKVYIIKYNNKRIKNKSNNNRSLF